jgi:hypothetical protein
MSMRDIIISGRCLASSTRCLEQIVNVRVKLIAAWVGASLFVAVLRVFSM